MSFERTSLLTGTCTYPCFHKFSWILDHHLSLTGDRSPNVHSCPRCTTENPTCLVCRGPFDARTADSCPGCDLFFAEPLLEDRCRRLEALSAGAAGDGPAVDLRARIARRKALFRAKYAGGIREARREEDKSQEPQNTPP